MVGRVQMRGLAVVGAVLVGAVQVWSGLVGVFGVGFGLGSIWSGRFCVFGGWSGLFGFVQGVRGGFRAGAYLVGVFLRVRGLVGFGQVCSGCSGCSGWGLGWGLSGRGDSACSGAGRFWSGLVGVFGVGFGLRPIWSGRFCVFGGWSVLVRFVRVWSGCSGSEVGIGGSVVLLWESDGIRVWGGMGAARREVLRTGVGGQLRDSGAVNGVGFGPQIKSGATDPGGENDGEGGGVTGVGCCARRDTRGGARV